MVLIEKRNTRTAPMGTIKSTQTSQRSRFLDIRSLYLVERPGSLHGMRFCRKASQAAWARLRAPSLICAFFRWVRIVSSPIPSACAASWPCAPLDTKRKTAISRGVKRTGRGTMPSVICRAINHPATMGQPFSHPPFRGRPRARAGGNKQDTRQNQYRPHANTIAKTEHNNRAMRKASDIGSSDSFSGSVGKLAPGFRIKRAASWRWTRPNFQRVEP